MRNAVTCLLLSRWSLALHPSNCELLCDLSHAVCHRSFFLFTASGLNPRCLFPTHCPHPPHTPLSGPCSLFLFVLLAYIVSCIHYLSSLHPVIKSFFLLSLLTWLTMSFPPTAPRVWCVPPRRSRVRRQSSLEPMLHLLSCYLANILAVLFSGSCPECCWTSTILSWLYPKFLCCKARKLGAAIHGHHR